MKKVKALLKKAISYEGKMQVTAGELALEFQPFFPVEISVEYQPGDGFVIVGENAAHKAPFNIPVLDAFENIKKNHKFYEQTTT
jgi:hypothetical protein